MTLYYWTECPGKPSLCVECFTVFHTAWKIHIHLLNIVSCRYMLCSRLFLLECMFVLLVFRILLHFLHTTFNLFWISNFISCFIENKYLCFDCHVIINKKAKLKIVTHMRAKAHWATNWVLGAPDTHVCRGNKILKSCYYQLNVIKYWNIRNKKIMFILKTSATP